MTFYNDRQGFVQCTVGELREALYGLPDDYVVSPQVTYDRGAVLAVQTSFEDGQWFVGVIDLSTADYREMVKGDKVDANPAYAPVWSFVDRETLDVMRNSNPSYPPADND